MIDIHSQTWQTLVQLLKQDLERLHEGLEAVGQAEAETNAKRGEIRCVKRILALATPPDRDGGGSPTYGLEPSSLALF